ncbi:MAG: TAT-variant-translocated molybdopterin oxidoreductase [Verrucomicrobia bacterium]|nr:TAT-variant-translocated molybdopterin oxidoreductase [Verrucomicrobiota bacterium]
MKKIFQHPARDANPTLWRTQAERENSPAFAAALAREFTPGSGQLSEEEVSALSRRDFVRLMGAATALTGVGLTGCRRPEAHLVPFAKSAEWTIPGKFLYYASSMPTPAGAVPLIVTTSDGRPTKIEGNPLHPVSNGSTDVFAQASVLDLYDPNRSKEITHDSRTVGRGDLDNLIAKIRAAAGANRGDGLAIVVGKENSPTLERLRTGLAAQFPKMLWVQDEAISSREADAAFDLMFGAGARPACDFTKADVILSISSDFLNPAENGFGYANGFAKRRDPKGAMNRLYVAENGFSLTGGMADHRLRVRASEYGDFAVAVANAVAAKTGNADLKALASAYPIGGASFDPAWIKGVADDLISAKGKSLVLVGVQQSASLRALVIGINAALGNLGMTVSVRQTGAKSSATLADLCAAIKAGSVQTLLILGNNPVYTAPADLNFPNLLASVTETLHLSMFADETSKVCHWHVPSAHYLERWGDARSLDGTICPIQPMILPLWNGLSSLEILGALAGEKTDGPSQVRATFSGVAKDGSDAAWNSFLKNGFAAGTAWSLSAPSLDSSAALSVIKSAKAGASGDFEVVFLRSSSVDDGRYAANSWLQETPDFVTKLVWDNAALVSPADARMLGIKDGDWLKISAGNRSIEAAALIAPGHADKSISIALGYGRQGVSHVMEKVGFDAYPLRDASNLAFRTGVKVQVPPLTSDLQWGLSVDLNSCIGCNACLVACRSENNVPVVGKDQVRRGRDMAWIRIDRWFASADHKEENIEMIPMAIMCQQCESAPCEAVCPANATVHSEEGLNLMAYNRCIGTRYCANNCPWKVRRFNYFDYNERPLDELYYGPLAPKGMADSLKMSKNPNVTVRMRGVMEKCTFCIQRIEEAKIARSVKASASDVTKTPLPAFKTACQQACPSESIVFGNINDPESVVSKRKADPRTYSSLNYLNTRPRVTYMARIRNPNPAMPGADMVGAANRHEEGHAPRS